MFMIVFPQYPDHGLNRLTERLLLFRHDYNSQNMLLPINAASDVTDSSLVEIVVSGKKTHGSKWRARREEGKHARNICNKVKCQDHSK